MNTLSMPGLILIAGTGRNVGKTTLACCIINEFSAIHPITAVKISSHYHKAVACGNIIIQREDLYVAEETDNSKTKDSSRFLKAGAQKSYFVMAADERQLEAIEIIRKLNNTNDFYVCESGGLRNWVKPGVFLIVHRTGTSVEKPGIGQLKDLCDRWITFDGNQFDFSTGRLEISHNAWHLKE
jgi:hypothetical protein